MNITKHQALTRAALAYLKGEILNLIKDIGLDQDAGIKAGDDEGEALTKLDTYLMRVQRKCKSAMACIYSGNRQKVCLKRDLGGGAGAGTAGFGRGR